MLSQKLTAYIYLEQKTAFKFFSIIRFFFEVK